MTDILRDIGGLEARMDEHAKRFDKLDEKIDSGFSSLNGRLDTLTANENKRSGALGLVKVILGSAGFYGLYEVVKGFWHK